MGSRSGLMKRKWAYGVTRERSTYSLSFRLGRRKSVVSSGASQLTLVMQKQAIVLVAAHPLFAVAQVL